MRYGYWMPVFGGWLRNVEEENMPTTWDYVKKLAIRSEQIGFVAVRTGTAGNTVAGAERSAASLETQDGSAMYRPGGLALDTQEMPADLHDHVVAPVVTER